MICGRKTLKDGMSKETICEKKKRSVMKIKEFVREQRLQWFGYVERIDNEIVQLKQQNF